MWVVNACRVDLNDLVRDDLADGIVAINQAQGSQGEREGPVEPLDLLQLDVAILQQPTDRHRRSPDRV